MGDIEVVKVVVKGGGGGAAAAAAAAVVGLYQRNTTLQTARSMEPHPKTFKQTPSSRRSFAEAHQDLQVPCSEKTDKWCPASVYR